MESQAILKAKTQAIFFLLNCLPDDSVHDGDHVDGVEPEGDDKVRPPLFIQVGVEAEEGVDAVGDPRHGVALE